jgi:hypothetical protein
MTESGALAATTMSTSPMVSAKRRSDPQYDASTTPGTSSKRATMLLASGSATDMGVRPRLPCASNRASDWASFSSDFSPKPRSARSFRSASTWRKSSIDWTPSSARRRLTAFAPSPWMRSSSTTPGGCFCLSVSSFCTLPVSSNSRILSAVLLPIPSIFWSSFAVSLPRSVACAVIAWAALS